MPKSFRLSLVMLVTCVLTLGVSQAFGAELADTVYHGGLIYTMTESTEEAKDVANAKTVEVVATKDGKIIFAGTKANAESAGYLDPEKVDDIVDLKGKTMLPGFIDPHGHFPNQGESDLEQVNLNSAPLGPMKNIADYIAALKAVKPAADPEDPDNPTRKEWILGWGYDDTLIEEGRHPTRQELDQVSTTHPIYITHISGHLATANTKALELAAAKIGSGTLLSDLPTHGGAGVIVDSAGDPTGVLSEMQAMRLVTIPGHPKTETENVKLRQIARANQVYAATGVTTADQGGSILVGSGLGADLALFQKSLDMDNHNIRLLFHPIGLYEEAGVDLSVINRAALGWDAATGFTTRTADTVDTHTDLTGYNVPEVPASTPPAIAGALTLLGYASSVAPAGLAEDKPDHLLLSSWKLFVDGSNQGYTGWFKKTGYYDQSGHHFELDYPVASPTVYTGLSQLNVVEEKINELIDFYHKNEQSVDVHTNGDRAAEAYVSALERVVAKYPDITDMRHTSIHAQMMERQHVQRLAGNYTGLADALNMSEEVQNWNLDGTLKTGSGLCAWDANGYLDPTGDCQVDDDTGADMTRDELATLMAGQNFVNSYFKTHTYFWGKRHRDIFMGPGRAKNISPTGWSIHYGLRYTLHNDTPVTPISPLRSVFSATTRHSYYAGEAITGSSKDVNAKTQYPATVNGPVRDFYDFDQRINVIQALHGITAMAAYNRKLEDKIGTIQPGLYADFVILDEDPVKVWREELLSLADIRIAATIVDDDVVYGFLPGSTNFASKPKPAFEQPEGVRVTMTDTDIMDDQELAENYAPLPEGHNCLVGASFTAEIAGGNIGVFQMEFLGNGSSVGEMQLNKMVNATETAEFTYGKPEPFVHGQFWIADMENPMVALGKSDTLEMDKVYLINFTIEDNASGFDSNPAAGIIEDPLTLTTTGALPGNGSASVSAGSGGSSSSGCSFNGETSGYGLLLLFIGALVLGFVRFVRARKM